MVQEKLTKPHKEIILQFKKEVNKLKPENKKKKEREREREERDIIYGSVRSGIG